METESNGNKVFPRNAADNIIRKISGFFRQR